jgi:hypothetical protein
MVSDNKCKIDELERQIELKITENKIAMLQLNNKQMEKLEQMNEEKSNFEKIITQYSFEFNYLFKFFFTNFTLLYRLKAKLPEIKTENDSLKLVIANKNDHINELQKDFDKYEITPVKLVCLIQNAMDNFEKVQNLDQFNEQYLECAMTYLISYLRAITHLNELFLRENLIVWTDALSAASNDIRILKFQKISKKIDNILPKTKIGFKDIKRLDYDFKIFTNPSCLSLMWKNMPPEFFNMLYVFSEQVANKALNLIPKKW